MHIYVCIYTCIDTFLTKKEDIHWHVGNNYPWGVKLLMFNSNLQFTKFFSSGIKFWYHLIFLTDTFVIKCSFFHPPKALCSACQYECTIPRLIPPELSLWRVRVVIKLSQHALVFAQCWTQYGTTHDFWNEWMRKSSIKVWPTA